MNWEHVIENGSDWWLSEIGNIVKTEDGKFVVLFPKILSIGPFDSLEVAQNIIEEKKTNLDKVIDNFNQEILDSLKGKKNE